MKIKSKILSVLSVVGVSACGLLLFNNKSSVNASTSSNFNGSISLYSTKATNYNDYYYLSNPTSNNEVTTGSVNTYNYGYNIDNVPSFICSTGISSNFANSDYFQSGISSDLKTSYINDGYISTNGRYYDSTSTSKLSGSVPYLELANIESTDNSVSGEKFRLALTRNNYDSKQYGFFKLTYKVQETGFYRCNFDMSFYNDSDYTMYSDNYNMFCKVGSYYTYSDNSVSFSGVYGLIRAYTKTNNSNYITSSYLYVYGIEGSDIEYTFYYPVSSTQWLTSINCNINCNYFNTLSGYEEDLQEQQNKEKKLNDLESNNNELQNENETLIKENETLTSEVEELKEKLGTYSGSPFESMVISSQVATSDTMNVLTYNDLLNNKYEDIYIDSGKLHIKKSSYDMIYQFSGLNVPISSIYIKSINDTGSSYIEYNLKDKETICTNNLSADSIQSLTAYSNVSYINLYINSDMSSDSEIIISLDSDNYYYTKGYNDGLVSGDSYQNGYSKGYDNGKIDGINSGSTNTTISKVATLFDTILSYPASFIATAFNFELFGINISSIIFFIITLSIVGGIIAFILGKRK